MLFFVVRPDAKIRWPYLASIAVLCIAAFSIAAIPINSNDFWWHLKTGQYIVEERILPETDPFTYTAMPDDPDFPGRPKFILKQYWLSQTVYAAVYNGFGLSGIIVLRGLTYASIALIAALLASAVSARRASLFMLPLLALAVTVAIEDSDRPQNFTYLFSILTIFIVELAVSRNNKRLLYLNIPVLLIASNMHGGYFIIAAFLVSYSICAFFERRLQPMKGPLILSTALAVSAAYLNPNHYNAFVEAFRSTGDSPFSKGFLEYKSPLSILPYVLSSPWWLAYWALSILSLPSVFFHLRERNYSSGIVLLGALAGSLLSMRLSFFFIPIGAAFSSPFLEKAVFSRLKPRPVVESGLSIILLLLIVFSAGNPNRFGIKVAFDPMLFPVKGSDFIIQKSLPRHIFNEVNWGGYLIFRLAPEYKMFVDTRYLAGKTQRDYHEIMGYTETGRQLIALYGIATVITPAIDPYAGRILPLVSGLYEDPGWSVVYSDGQALIFVRKGLYPEEKPKSQVYYEVLAEVKKWRPAFPHVGAYEDTVKEAMEKIGLR